MENTNTAIDKLQRVQQLWAELDRTKMNTPEYQTIIEKIRVLSAEYQVLVDAQKKREKSKMITIGRSYQEFPRSLRHESRMAGGTLPAYVVVFPLPCIGKDREKAGQCLHV